MSTQATTSTRGRTAAPPPDWHSDRDGDGIFYRHGRTGARTPSFPKPGAALEAARKLDEAMASGQLPSGVVEEEAPDADLIVARLNFAETRAEFEEAVAEHRLRALLEDEPDPRFGARESREVKAALDDCERRFGGGGEPAVEKGEGAGTSAVNDVPDEGEAPDPAPYVPDEFAHEMVGEGLVNERGIIPPASRPGVTLDPKRVRTDGGTQARAALHEPTVEEYAEAMRAGEEFPAVVVFYDGADYWLADGFHRQAATLYVGRTYIVADVRQGSRRDAVLYAVGANARHGLRRSDADRRRSVETLLRDPEWSKWSNREVARRCGVSKSFVGDVREALTGARAPEEVKATRGGTEYTVNTSNLAGPRQQQPGDAPAEAPPSPSEESSPAAASAEAEGSAHAPAAEASAGATTSESIKVTDRRRFADEAKPDPASSAHVAPRPDRLMERWAAIQGRLKGRGFIVSHSFLPRGLGYMVTVNLSDAPPTDATNSKLFDAPKGKVPFFFDSELDLIEKRLDADKGKPKPPAKSAQKSSKKAATKKQVLGAKAAAKRQSFKKGDKVLVSLNGRDKQGVVDGVSLSNKNKLRVKVGTTTHDYYASQLRHAKAGGATKKSAKGGK